MKGDQSATPSIQGEQFALNIIIAISGLLSITSTGFAIVYFIFKRPVKFRFEILAILCLIVSDLVQASAVTIPSMYFWIADQDQMPSDYASSTGCIMQAFFEEWGCISQFFWTFVIAYSTYKATIFENRSSIRTRKIVLSSLGIALPLLFAFLPLLTNSYTQSELPLSYTICFIETNSSASLGAKLVPYVAFGIPLIATLIVNFTLFRLVCLNLRSLAKGEYSYQFEYKLMLYPLILLICQGWFVITIFITTLTGDPAYVYQIWCYFMSNLTGFFDSIAYGAGALDRQQSGKYQSQMSLTSLFDEKEQNTIELG